MLTTTKKRLGIGATALILAACATTQEPSDRLVALESQYKTLVQKGYVEQYAPIALAESSEAIAKLEAMEKSGASEAERSHQQYLAQKKLDTALEKAKYNQAEELISNSDVRRKEVQLAAQERQAQSAMATAEAMRTRAVMAEKQAAEATARAASLEGKAQALSDTLANITAEESDRGLVLTMGSILFELEKAELKSGSEKALKRVAALLSEYPEREVLVEGYTDSTGNDAYNQELSERRAQAVADALTTNGVDSSRLTTRGYGESYPVANNDTSAGRQQNRRVELVIGKTDESSVTARD